MTKWMDKVYKNSVWVLISALLLAYFFYRTLDTTGSLEQTINDWRTWVHVLFVVFLNVEMVAGAYDMGSSTGLSSEEFDTTDKLNNKLITEVNNSMEEFRDYVKKLNEHELQSMREDYLFSVGDKTYDELTYKERKAYDKLKPIRHNIYGFNLPLYYEVSKNGKIDYKASIKRNEGKTSAQVKRAFMGLLFGAMTVNVVFSLDNVVDAMISVMVITAGLISTFMLIYFPQVFKFRFTLPKKVLLKKTLYDSYKEFRDGKIKLKELAEVKEREAYALAREQVFVIQT